MDEARWNSGIFVLIEVILIFGLILAFGFFELRNLDKLKKEREAKEREAAEALSDQTKAAEPQQTTPS